MARFNRPAATAAFERAHRVAGSAIGRPEHASVRLVLSPDGSCVRAASDGLRFESPLDVSGLSEDVVHAVPAQLLSDTFSRLSGDVVTMESDDERVAFRSGSGVYRLRRTDASDLLPVPVPTGEVITFERGDLFRALAAASVATSRDSGLRALSAIRLELKDGAVTVVATDSHRLTRVDLDVEVSKDAGNASALLPARLVALLPRLFGRTGRMSATIAADGASVSFDADGCRLVTSTVEAEFPRWRQLLAATPASTVVASRTQLLELFERAGLYGPHADLTLDGGTLRVSVADDSGDVEETVAVRSSDVPSGWSARFQVAYLLDAVRSLPDVDDVTIRVGSSAAAIWLTAASTVHLVMPRR